MIFCPSMKTCHLFPGQGAQYPGMGEDLWNASPAVKELFRRASESSGLDMAELLFRGSAAELFSTDKTQLAVTLADISCAAVLREKGVAMDGCAGFSLGEYAALFEAGVIRLEDLFQIVKIRGELMEQASRNLDSSDGRPGMAAVLGLSEQATAEAVDSLRAKGVYVANRNSPVQTVLSGTAAGIAAAEQALKAAGAKRIVRLKVSGPFHSPLMKEAQAEFERELSRFEFSNPRVPVYSNVTGKPIGTGEEARELCGKQLVSPVNWVSVERNLMEDGFARFIEAGPGTVLTGLFRALAPQATCLPAGELSDIEKIGPGG
jgi:[acyl-carrier-protein] S-malonyltransferase